MCLKTCSCYFSSNLTLELKARSQNNGELAEYYCSAYTLYIHAALERNTDLVLPSELIVNAQSNCFEVTAVDDDLLEGFEAMILLLYKPNGERYHICEDSKVLPVSVVDNDGKSCFYTSICVYAPEAYGYCSVCVQMGEEGQK